MARTVLLYGILKTFTLLTMFLNQDPDPNPDPNCIIMLDLNPDLHVFRNICV